MSITVTGVTDFQQYMRDYLKKVDTPKQRQRILKAGAVVVRRKVKTMLPKRKDRYAYNYDGRQIVVKKPFYYRAKGIGIQALMIKGNLANYIYAFQTKRGEVEVGPRRLRGIKNGSIIGGTPPTSSGYYASMLLRSAENFRRSFTERAYILTEPKVVQRMIKTFERIHKQLTR